MATLTTTMPPKVEPSPLRGEFQAWSFEKAMLEAQQRSPSESSTADFFDAEEGMRLTPTIEELKRTIEEQKSPVTFNERYMSSEEALSPTEHEGEESADDSSSVYEAEFSSAVKFGICDMAVAICIFAVGRAKVIDLQVPSLTSSPSIGSEYGVPERNGSIPAVLRKPMLRERNPNRPGISTQHAATPYADMTAVKPSHSVSTSIEEYDNRRHSIFRSFTEQSPHTPSQIDTSFSHSTNPSFLTQDPFANTARPRPQHSRLRNLSQKISRFAIYSPTKTDSSDSSPETHVTKLRKVSTTGLRRGSFPRQEPETPVTPDASPAPKRKMIARGAAERAPPPEIPPCPYDIGDDGALILQERPERVRRRKSLLGLGL